MVEITIEITHDHKTDAQDPKISVHSIKTSDHACDHELRDAKKIVDMVEALMDTEKMIIITDKKAVKIVPAGSVGEGLDLSPAEDKSKVN